MRGHSDEHLRSFSTGRAIVPRQDLLGVAFAPLDRLWYETVDGGATTTFLRTVPVEAGFDKIALREGWAAKDYYLLLDGISGGGHSYQDGNCIVRYAEQGVNWASNTYHDHASATVRQQNGVFVAVNGAGPGQLHRGARRLYAEASGDYLAAASVLEGIGEADWQRHVLRKRGTWTLVVDRVLVKRPGEVLAERHWHLGGQITPTADGLVSRSMGRCLHLQTAGILPEGMRGTSDRIEVLRAQAEPDQPLELATLLSVNTNPKRADVRLVETVNGWRVETAGRVEFAIPSRLGDGMTVLVPSRAVHLGKTEQGKMLTYEQALSGRATGLPMRSGKTLPVRPQFPTVSLPWRTLHAGPGAVTALARAADGRVAAGDRSGTVVIFAPDGTRRTSARFPSPIQALHFLGTDLLVGEDRGALTRLSADGSQCWQLLIPYVSLPWAYWSEGRSRIREISSADIQGKGQPTIFVANSDRRLYALTAEGKELWKTPVEWGVFTAMSVARQGKGYTLLGGTSQPSIFGRCILFRTDGKLLTHYSRADLHSWSNPSQFRDLRLADLDGDGRLEAVCGVDTDCRQLVVFQSDGKIRWEADVAGAANAVAVRASEAAGGPIVYCASNSGYVYGFDSRTGRRRFATFVGEPTHFVAPVAGGRVIAVGRSGMVFVLGDEGQVAGRVALDRSITGLLRPGEDRSTNAVLLGTVEGNIMELVNP
jgi:outer membrane protein assembly factor BamB